MWIAVLLIFVVITISVGMHILLNQLDVWVKDENLADRQVLVVIAAHTDTVEKQYEMSIALNKLHKQEQLQICILQSGKYTVCPQFARYIHLQENNSDIDKFHHALLTLEFDKYKKVVLLNDTQLTELLCPFINKAKDKHIECQRFKGTTMLTPTALIRLRQKMDTRQPDNIRYKSQREWNEREF